MKTILYAFLLVMLSLCMAPSYTEAKGHNIKITIKGYPKDSMARIGYYYGKSRFLAEDTAYADKNGTFIFKGKKDLPQGVYICLFRHGYFEFLVTEQSFALETDTADFDMHMKVKGSKENSIFYEFRKYTTVEGRKADSLNKIFGKAKSKDSVKMYRAKANIIDKNVDSFRRDFIAKYPTSLEVVLLTAAREPVIPESPLIPGTNKKDSTFPYRYFKLHYFDNLNFGDERLVRTPFFESKLDYYFKDLVEPFPDSIIYDADKLIAKTKASKEAFKYTLSWILNHYEDSQYMGMDAVAVHLIEKYYFTGEADWVSEKDLRYMRVRDSVVAKLLLGKIIPDAYLTDSNGKVITLHSVNHKYTIFMIWDATCGHCQKAMPILHSFYQKNKGKYDIEVYAATIERKTKDWKKYIVDHNMGDWINVWDSYTVTDFNKVYDAYSTPVMYILDKDKKIIAKRLDPAQLDEYFENLAKREKNLSDKTKEPKQ